MVIKLWTMSQVATWGDSGSKIEIPREVKDYVIKILGILDDYYDIDRDVDTDDGGYVKIITYKDKELIVQNYQDILQQYNLDKEDIEFEDELYTDELGEWVAHTYFVHMEFGIVVIFNKKYY